MRKLLLIIITTLTAATSAYGAEAQRDKWVETSEGVVSILAPGKGAYALGVLCEGYLALVHDNQFTVWSTTVFIVSVDGGGHTVLDVVMEQDGMVTFSNFPLADFLSGSEVTIAVARKTNRGSIKVQGGSMFYLKGFSQAYNKACT